MSNFTTYERAFKSHLFRDRPLRVQRSCLIVEAKKTENSREKQETSRGTPDRPRLSVFRSNNHIYAQVIDDTQSHTLCSASTLMKQVIETTGGRGSDERAAYIVGKLVGKRALQKGISQVCFDGGDFSYKGRVKAVGEGAKAAGLEF